MPTQHDRTTYHSGVEPATTVVIDPAIGMYPVNTTVQDVLEGIDARFDELESGNRVFGRKILNAVIQKTPTKTLTANARISGTAYHTARMRARISNATTRPGSFSGHAYIPALVIGPVTADAVIKALMPKSFEAISGPFLRLYGHNEASFTADARFAYIRTMTSDAIFTRNTEKRQRLRFYAYARIVIRSTGINQQLRLDAVLRKGRSSSLTANALLSKHHEPAEMLPNTGFEYNIIPWTPAHPEREGWAELVDWDGSQYDTGRGAMYVETYDVSTDEGARYSGVAKILKSETYRFISFVKSLGLPFLFRQKVGYSPADEEVTEHLIDDSMWHRVETLWTADENYPTVDIGLLSADIEEDVFLVDRVSLDIARLTIPMQADILVGTRMWGDFFADAFVPLYFKIAATFQKFVFEDLFNRVVGEGLGGSWVQSSPTVSVNGDELVITGESDRNVDHSFAGSLPYIEKGIVSFDFWVPGPLGIDASIEYITYAYPNGTLSSLPLRLVQEESGAGWFAYTSAWAERVFLGALDGYAWYSAKFLVDGDLPEPVSVKVWLRSDTEPVDYVPLGMSVALTGMSVPTLDFVVPQGLESKLDNLRVWSHHSPVSLGSVLFGNGILSRTMEGISGSPTVVATTTLQGSGTFFYVSKPSGQPGDLLLCFISVDDPNIATVTEPYGQWTRELTLPTAGADGKLEVWSIPWANASASQGFSIPGAYAKALVFMTVRASGPSLGWSIAIAATAVSDTYTTTPTINGASYALDTLAVVAFAGTSYSTTWATPSGWAEQAEVPIIYANLQVLTRTSAPAPTASVIGKPSRPTALLGAWLNVRKKSYAVWADAFIFVVLYADAVIRRRDGGGTFTLDARVASNIRATAVIFKSDITGSITIDAIPTVPIESSFTSEAWMDVQASFIAEAALAVTEGGGLSADAVILVEQPGSFTADAIHMPHGTFDADADILAEMSGTFTYSSVLTMNIESSVSADAVILAPTSSSITSDAAFYLLQLHTFTENAVKFATIEKTFPMNAALGATARVSQVVTEVVVLPTDVSSRVSQVVVEVVTPNRYFMADAVIRKTQTGSLTGNPAIDPYFVGAPVIPVMTSNTAPSGTVTYSGQYYAAWYAFWPGNPNWGWLSAGAALPQWLGYQFPTAQTVKGYAMRAYYENIPSRRIKTWKFQGSTDGNTWVDLDQQTDYVWVNATDYFEFTIASPASYAYYRVYVTADWGGGYVGIGGLQMYA